jgi:D-beta-D-heptose 7-phosphate kinase/D-beta-D-heptose 1-phosphate adenosyltransferase
MEKLTQYIPKFAKQRILVLGDLMVDKFVWGKVSRISPEAPVPVVEVTRESQAFGGAGNVANNITSLGGQAFLLGVVGNDTDAEHLIEGFQSKSISIEGIITDHTRPTTSKTRIIAQHQQVVRVDREVKGNFDAKIQQAIMAKLEDMVKRSDAMIISDYGKGVINGPVLKNAINLARRHHIPVTVDPKLEHFMDYKKVTCITPNLSEAIGGMRYRNVSEDKDIYELGRKILKKLNSSSVLITRGEKGMTLFQPGNKITHIPTRAKEVYDVTGAGDTVISVFTLALAAGASLPVAADISNFAAGVVVGKLGTATVTQEELRTAINNFKNNSK